MAQPAPEPKKEQTPSTPEPPKPLAEEKKEEPAPVPQAASQPEPEKAGPPKPKSQKPDPKDLPPIALEELTMDAPAPASAAKVEVSSPITEMPSGANYVSIGKMEPKDREVFRPLVNTASFLPWTEIVGRAVNVRASDIICNRGGVYMRVGGQVEPYPIKPAPDLETYEKGLMSILPAHRNFTELMGELGATDFAPTIDGKRLRGNVYFELNGLNAVFRPISSKPLSNEELGLDAKILDLVLKSKQGLVLVSGPTGSGKSATVVGILEELNYNCNYNIITIEDPIEFLFTPQKCTFSQREVGLHAASFDTALRSALRQNPDVIFVGEIRDYPTMAAALKAAETGHLVFATLHTRRVYTTLNRLINIAPASERDQIRDAIAQNILLVMCQRLLKGAHGGLVACREIAIRCNPLLGCIMSGKMRDINTVMLSNRQSGMIDWQNALNELLRKKLITSQEAALYRDREDDV